MSDTHQQDGKEATLRVLEIRYQSGVLAYLKTARRASAALIAQRLDLDGAVLDSILETLIAAGSVARKDTRDGPLIHILPAGEVALSAHLEQISVAIEQLDPRSAIG